MCPSICNFKGYVTHYMGQFSLEGYNEPRTSDRGPTTGSQSFCSRPSGIKTFIMLECLSGKEGRVPRLAGVLNNAIWPRGVATLCGLCHAYHDHIRLHFEVSRNPSSCSFLPLPPLPLCSLSLIAAGFLCGNEAAPTPGSAYIVGNRMLIGKY